MDYKDKLHHICKLFQDVLGTDGNILFRLLGDDSEPNTIFAIIEVSYKYINLVFEVGVTLIKNYHLFLSSLSLTKELEEIDVFTTIINKILSCALIDKLIVCQSTNDYLNSWCKVNHFIEMDGDYYKTFEGIKGYSYEYTTYVCNGEVISDVYKVIESSNSNTDLPKREKLGSIKRHHFDLDATIEFINNFI